MECRSTGYFALETITGEKVHASANINKTQCALSTYNNINSTYGGGNSCRIMMNTTLNHVKTNDRLATIIKCADDISVGKVSIANVSDRLGEITQCKRHFAHFYGDHSLEHKLAHHLSTFSLFITRSIARQLDNGNSTVEQWSSVSPLRGELCKAIKLLSQRLLPQQTLHNDACVND